MEERITTCGVAEESGLFLVAKRMKGGPLSEKWEFVGGKNRWGESVEETLEREWKEELNLSVEVGEYLTKTEFTNECTHYTLICHRVKVKGGEIKLSVHQEIRWVDKKGLLELEYGDSDSAIKDWIVKNL